MKVLVTGASGWIGRCLCTRLIDGDFQVRAAVRSVVQALREFEVALVKAVDDSTDWRVALTGIQVVVHAAARVHVMNDHSTDPLAEFRKVNVQGTLNLARQAAAAGVRRFVFISSIKVNGESTQPGRLFAADDVPAPRDAYGISKMEAEQGLRQIADETGMEVVIIRPPLVYGPGVKANFAAMMRWLQRGVPLPFGAIHNQRSLVALDNLVDLIVLCLAHPSAANQTFLVSDGEDVSTSELLCRMGQAMGRPARLIPVPANLLKLAAALLGKSDVAQRLCGSLQVDITKTRQLLCWTPSLSLSEGLKKAAEGRRV